MAQKSISTENSEDQEYLCRNQRQRVYLTKDAGERHHILGSVFNLMGLGTEHNCLVRLDSYTIRCVRFGGWNRSWIEWTGSPRNME
jgi:hypothetical protein